MLRARLLVGARLARNVLRRAGQKHAMYVFQRGKATGQRRYPSRRVVGLID